LEGADYYYYYYYYYCYYYYYHYCIVNLNLERKATQGDGAPTRLPVVGRLRNASSRQLSRQRTSHHTKEALIS